MGKPQPTVSCNFCLRVTFYSAAGNDVNIMYRAYAILPLSLLKSTLSTTKPFYLFLPWELWDLSSPTKDWPQALAMRTPSPNHWTPGNCFHQAFCRTYPVEHASSRNLLLQVLFLAWHMNYYRFQCLFQQPEEFQWHSFGFSLKNSLKGLIPIVRQHFLFWDCSVAEKCLLYWFFSLWQASISWSSGPHFHYSFLFHGWRDSDTWTGSYSIFPPLYPLIIRLWPIAGRALEQWEP